MKFAIVFALFALVAHGSADNIKINQEDFMKIINDFGSQSFDQYRLKFEMNIKDPEFDYHKLPGATSDSTARWNGHGTEYHQKNRYTFKASLPIEGVDTQLQYWTGSNAFLVQVGRYSTQCEKVEHSAIMPSFSEVLVQFAKTAEFSPRSLDQPIMSSGIRLVAFVMKELNVSGWATPDRPRFPIHEITYHAEKPEDDSIFNKFLFQPRYSLPLTVFEVPSICHKPSKN